MFGFSILSSTRWGRKRRSPSAGHQIASEVLESRVLLTDAVPNDTLLTATPDVDLSNDSIGNHPTRIIVDNLSQQDVRDFHRFHAGVKFDGGNEVEIRLTGPGQSELQQSDLRFRVYNSRGVRLTTGVGKSLTDGGESPGFNNKVAVLTVSGTSTDAQAFFVEVYGAPLGVNAEYEVDIIYVSANHTPVDFYDDFADQPGLKNDSQAEAGPIKSPDKGKKKSAKGQLGGSDVKDWFRIVSPVPASGTFTIYLTPEKQDLDFEVWSTDKSNSTSRIGVAKKSGKSQESFSFKTKTALTYYIVVFPKNKLTVDERYTLDIFFK